MKLLVEIILTLGLIGAWIVVSMTASDATRTDVAVAAAAATSTVADWAAEGRTAIPRPGGA